MAPRLSVILPVYNAGVYLRAAIDSILNQSFTDYEFIIIDDGSTDESPAVISSYHDPRIRHIKQDNRGLRATLNTGIGLSRGEYVARMDQDDISLPDRLRQQIKFFEHHSQYVLVGTTYAYIDQHGHITGIFPALTEDEDIRRELLTKSPFGHGTVMFQTKMLRAGNFQYSLDAVHVEDYELWLRIASAGKLANLREVLYFWRQSSTNTTSHHAVMQRRQTKALQDQNLQYHPPADLVGWPGWEKIQGYHNEWVTLQGRDWRVARRDAHSSLYLNLAALFWSHRQFGPAMLAACYAFLVHPGYPFKVFWRALQNQPRI